MGAGPGGLSGEAKNEAPETEKMWPQKCWARDGVRGPACPGAIGKGIPERLVRQWGGGDIEIPAHRDSAHGVASERVIYCDLESEGKEELSGDLTMTRREDV